MRIGTTICVVVVLVFLSQQGFAAGLPLKSAQAWWRQREETGIVLVERFREQGFRLHSTLGQAGTRLELNQGGYRITVGFKKKLSANTAFQDLADCLEYVAIDRLPTRGLRVKNWEFIPRTPTSRIDKGVEVLDFRDGRLVLRVRTQCFALWGRDTSVVVPADASMPEGSFLQIREARKLDLTIDCPIQFAAPEQR